MTPSVSAATTPCFKKAAVRESSLLLALAVGLPPLLHLLPSWDALPLGAHLLAMFWVTFVAAYLYGSRTGVLIGLASPVVNLLLTGLPAWKFTAVLGFELVVFALLAAWLVRRFPLCWLLAPLAGVAALLAGTGLLTAADGFRSAGAAVGFFRLSLGAGFPGLVLLTVVNLLLVKLQPKH